MVTAPDEWEAHVGLDYVVVMRGNEMTDNASIRLFGEDAAKLATMIAALPDLLTANDAACHALRSYQYGNASTELAEAVANRCNSATEKALGLS